MAVKIYHIFLVSGNSDIILVRLVLISMDECVFSGIILSIEIVVFILLD